MSKTKFGTFEGEIFWARVFEGNIDNSDYHKATEGQYNCVFIPKDDAELQKMYDTGLPKKSMNYDTVREYDYADGRKGVKLKRPNKHRSVADFGGAPKVLNAATKKPWDYEIDGPLGNTSKVKVKVSFYGAGSTTTVRLEQVDVVELVKYESANEENGLGW